MQTGQDGGKQGIHTNVGCETSLKHSFEIQRRQEDNDKMDFSGIICKDGRWMKIAQDHVQSQALVAIGGAEPSGSDYRGISQVVRFVLK